jgi:hypothetical protein
MSNIGPIDDKKMQRLADISQAVEHEFVLRGKKVRVDEAGFVSLNDIHTVAGFSKNRRPIDWQRLPTTSALILALHKRLVGKSHQSKFRTSDVYRAASGVNGGTWAHPILAAAYAGYLKPELEVEMREVWLRFKAADATLADEILERATDEENEWAATRAMGRAKRGEFTKTLDAHGVEGFGYATCTDAVYKELFDANAKKLKESRGLSKSAKLRDAMSKDELVYIMMAETLAKGRIKDENPNGNGPCAQSTKRSAYFVRQAIEADKNDRQKPLDL